MEPPRRPPRGGHASRSAPPGRSAIAVVAVVAYAVLASFTHPFTVPADVVTAVALGAACVVMVVRIARRAPTDRGGSGGSPAAAVWSRWWPLWWVPLAATLGWELVTLTSSPRERHPTLSSVIDLLDGTHAGKTVAFAAWLALGWFLVRR